MADLANCGEDLARHCPHRAPPTASTHTRPAIRAVDPSLFTNPTGSGLHTGCVFVPGLKVLETTSLQRTHSSMESEPSVPRQIRTQQFTVTRATCFLNTSLLLWAWAGVTSTGLYHPYPRLPSWLAHGTTECSLCWGPGAR